MKKSAGRVVAVLAIVAVAVLLVAFVGGDDDYEITAEFQNASQLVPGNQVMVGGLAAGSVKEIGLGDDGEAEVTFTVSDDYAPLPRGTTATIRQGSLSSVAGRQIQLTLPPEGTDTQGEIEDGGAMTQSETVSAVDLDQIFNTLDVKTVKDFKEVITGFRDSYEGVTKQANEGSKYFNPLLSTSRRVFGELNRSPDDLESLIVNSASLSALLAERRDDLSALVSNASGALGAIGRQRQALADTINQLPDFLRQANTTFVNLRFTLDDVDPLVAASIPVADRLGPFFEEFRAAAADAVPTIRDLDAIVRRPGKANDLVELTRLQVPLEEAGVGSGAPNCGNPVSNDYDPPAADEDFTQGSLGEANCALRNSNEQLSTLRAYTPELVGWFDGFSTSGLFDASGPLGRINSTFNAFSLALGSGLPDILSPIDPADVLSGTGAVDIDSDQRCPGSTERDPGDGSTPFTDGGALECDPTQLPVGP
ncbi:MAG: phospholipid/cholesterol/gamma-HCH transport system substrate-binding protein [Solirubrobacterales bacterium]|nr:phospholipid/cholesterol/gamma-HCH transport system substrate-binding protein [Solirubrobacterales bacterium]